MNTTITKGLALSIATINAVHEADGRVGIDFPTAEKTVFKVYNKTSTATAMALAEGDADIAGTSAVYGAGEVSMVSGVVGGDGESVKFSVDENGKTFVEAQMRTSLTALDETPEEIKEGTPYAIFHMDKDDLDDLLRKGCGAAEDSASASFELALSGDNAGRIMALSIDGGAYKFNEAVTQATFPEMPDAVKAAVEKALEKYLGEHADQSAESIRFAVGKKDLVNMTKLLALVDNGADLQLDEDGKHLTALFNAQIKYVCTLSADTPREVAKFIGGMAGQTGPEVQIDRDDLSKAVSNQLTVQNFRKDKGGITTTVGEDNILLVTGQDADTRQRLLNIKTSDDAAGKTVTFNGLLLKSALSQLNAGNVVLRITPGPVLLMNGTIDAPATGVMIGIMPVNPALLKKLRESQVKKEGSKEAPSEGTEADAAAETAPAESPAPDETASE